MATEPAWPEFVTIAVKVNAVPQTGFGVPGRKAYVRFGLGAGVGVGGMAVGGCGVAVRVAVGAMLGDGVATAGVAGAPEVVGSADNRPLSQAVGSIESPDVADAVETAVELANEGNADPEAEADASATTAEGEVAGG